MATLVNIMRVSARAIGTATPRVPKLYKDLGFLRGFSFKNEQKCSKQVEVLPGKCGGGAMIEAAIAIPILIALLFAGFAIMQMTLNTTLIERNLELAARAAALEANVVAGSDLTFIQKKSAVDLAASRVVDKLGGLNLHATSVDLAEIHTSSATCAIALRVQFESTCRTCDLLGIFSSSTAKTFNTVASPSECLS